MVNNISGQISLFGPQQNIWNDNTRLVIEKYRRITPDVSNKSGVRSLFYEAAKRDPGKYGQFLFYSIGDNQNVENDRYYKSESSLYNKGVSSLESKNPTAGFLVRETNKLENIYNKNGILKGSAGENHIIGGLSAPYYWKDFLYAKHYGTIPNNYMITLRRFPTPVLDNMSIPATIEDSDKFSKEGAGRPVAQAVTWFGGNTGNNLNDLISFTTGLVWDPVTQNDVKEQKAFAQGLFTDGPTGFALNLMRKIGGDLGEKTVGLFTSLTDAAYIGTDSSNTVTDQIIAKKMRELSKSQGGLLGEYIWTSVDTVDKGYVRGRGLTFVWHEISIVFEYEISSVGEVNSKAAFFDLLANLLSIGTNYGNFLVPQIMMDANMPVVGFPGGDAGLNKFYTDPMEFIDKYIEEIINPSTNADSSKPKMTMGKDGVDSAELETINSISNILGSITGNAKISQTDLNTFKRVFGESSNRILKFMLLSGTQGIMSKFQTPLSFLTGAPIGEWHLCIGNPCNPIAMIGNLLCENVNVEFGETLGPDDFPTSIKATFKLKHARDRDREGIESIFNRGNGRLYKSFQETSANSQSFGAHADVAGNVSSEETAQRHLAAEQWYTQEPGFDTKAPAVIETVQKTAVATEKVVKDVSSFPNNYPKI